jgi:hypothetical protein
MPTLLSFDSEFTFLFPPGEIDLLAQFTSDKHGSVPKFPFGYQLVLLVPKKWGVTSEGQPNLGADQGFAIMEVAMCRLGLGGR